LFNNTVKVEWIENESRKMRLIEPVMFVDGNGLTWSADAGDIIDGASIPRLFWRATGSPFVGRFRRASVIHDVYCVTKTRPSADVHRMFAEAMTFDGVPRWKRKLMYYAVRLFGPKW